MREGLPICRQQISTEDAHGEGARVCYWGKEAVPNANLLALRILLPSSDTIPVMMTTFPDPVSLLLLIPLLQVVISSVSVLAGLLQVH